MTHFHHLVEIGAGDRWSSEGLARAMAGHADKVTLYEPNSILRADLGVAAEYPSLNLTIRPEAVNAVGGQQLLYHLGYASYLAGEPSFYATSIEPEGVPFLTPLARAVEVVTTNQAITADVDALVLTAGGAERAILETMTARPKVLWTKHYCHRPEQWEETHQILALLDRYGYQTRVISVNQHRTFHALEHTLPA